MPCLLFSTQLRTKLADLITEEGFFLNLIELYTNKMDNEVESAQPLQFHDHKMFVL
jgi:hypothetical protein